MINIALHLNAYQPPTQLTEVNTKIIRESYGPVTRALEQYPHLRISLNIARSLGEKLPRELLNRLHKLHSSQQIELLNTSAYHFLLPLVPPATAKRQFELNLEFYNQYLRGHNNPLGIYLPEYAFSPALAPTLMECGYRWTILDDKPFEWARRNMPENDRVPFSWIPTHSGLACLLRSRYWSEKISSGEYTNGNLFAKELLTSHEAWVRHSSLDGYPPADSYIVLGVDFETFGHHPVGLYGLRDAIDRFLIPFGDRIAIEGSRARLMHPGIIVERFRQQKSESSLIAGSWSTDACHLEKGIPFPLWAHPENNFHTAWNQFMVAALHAVLQNKEQNPELIALTDRAFYSCSPWQYSYGNKNIATWCLPMFRRIIECFGKNPVTNMLVSSYKMLENICLN